MAHTSQVWCESRSLGVATPNTTIAWTAKIREELHLAEDFAAASYH